MGPVQGFRSGGKVDLMHGIKPYTQTTKDRVMVKIMKYVIKISIKNGLQENIH